MFMGKARQDPRDVLSVDGDSGKPVPHEGKGLARNTLGTGKTLRRLTDFIGYCPACCDGASEGSIPRFPHKGRGPQDPAPYKTEWGHADPRAGTHPRRGGTRACAEGAVNAEGAHCGGAQSGDPALGACDEAPRSGENGGCAVQRGTRGLVSMGEDGYTSAAEAQ
eukprot:gene16360-biopygen5030